MDAVQRFKRYGLTVVAIGAALAFARVFGEPSIWLVLAVLASTLYGGVGPGIAAVALSAGALISFFAEPHLPTFLGAALSVVAILEARRLVDIKARQAEDRLNTRLTVDSIPAMIGTMTATGEGEFFNSRLTEFFGKTKEEMKDWASLLHPEDRDRVVGAWMQSVATGEPLDFEHRSLSADGSYRWLTTRGLPVFDRKERVVRWYNLITDIDDRKRAEEALRASELNLRMIRRFGGDSLPRWKPSQTCRSWVPRSCGMLLNCVNNLLISF
jgi:PAS domain S-box-containing protein